MVEWSFPRATVSTLARAKGEIHEEEFRFIMTVACPLCTNLNEVLAQPSSISWKQVACSFCEANLVLVRESSSNTPRRSLASAIRLIAPSPGTRQRTVITRSHLLIVVATALALGVLGYLFFEGYLSFETGLFSNDPTPIESNVPSTTMPPPTLPPQLQTVSPPPLSTANEPVTK